MMVYRDSRQAYAAGREKAHAVNDGKMSLAAAIVLPEPYTMAWEAFWTGYGQGLDEK